MEPILIQVENITLVSASRSARLLILDIDDDLLGRSSGGLLCDPHHLLKEGDRLMIKTPIGWGTDFYVKERDGESITLWPVGIPTKPGPFFGLPRLFGAQW